MRQRATEKLQKPLTLKTPSTCLKRLIIGRTCVKHLYGGCSESVRKVYNYFIANNISTTVHQVRESEMYREKSTYLTVGSRTRGVKYHWKMMRIYIQQIQSQEQVEGKQPKAKEPENSTKN